MATEIMVSKKQLIKMIDELEKSPADKVRILGDVGVTVIGVGLGGAAAGTVASAVGVTTIPVLTAIGSWVGIPLVAATPLGWIIGVAAAGGVATYGISRLIHGGGLSEGRKNELLMKYREEAKRIEAKERAGNITDDDRTTFIVSTKELIERDALTPQKAKELFDCVENGKIPISEAILILQGLLTQSSKNAAC